PYPPHLTPQPSNFRPHCYARDRVQRWLPPVGVRRADLGLSDEALRRTTEALVHGWEVSTLEVYGAGLLTLHVWCDHAQIHEDARAPASSELIEAFMAALIGIYLHHSISNIVSGIRAWHVLHKLPWQLDAPRYDLMMRAAQAETTKEHRRPPRDPYTVDTLVALFPHFNLATSLDAAVWACATTLFYSVSRTGEFTVPAIARFDPAKHISAARVKPETDRQGRAVMSFALPSTKTKPHTGETVQWARQSGVTDPEAALKNHLAVNVP
ncbi:hypothetical protein FA95DRAFT_1459614, partial [Auriscalpium vulgare]